ncbi:C-reactive protein-like [Eublepharis macularius]|uniref:Pentraxin family member n=1 Tax=Eublepharis macularius TaxID=481883 RepID=A0AA97LGH4_EUBMA|nr:C-reactive protein-like [Eublepharis macularius]
MHKKFLPLLLLSSLLGSFAQEDLGRKAFVFPVASDTAYVVLKTIVQRPLTGFTLCMRFYTELTRTFSLFSYASERNYNEILIFVEKPNKYSLYLSDRAVTFDIPEKMTAKLGGEHICVSWESDTGLVEFWMNGQPMVRKSLKKGHSISTEASIILGQEQDSLGGGFDIDQSFVGEITDMYMWSRVLSPDEVVHTWYNEALPDCLINWRSLSYNITGYAAIKPALFSVRRAG